MTSRTIKVDYLARVEGEGSLYVRVRDGEVTDVKLTIFEPPRFFEAFLRGRSYEEVPDITARICGICPVAYQMSSVQAMEDALGVTVDEPLTRLRRLLYCGEWIESHVLHVYMLHAPDFLGYDNVIQMAKDYPDVVQKGLQLKKIGNEIVTLVGGREIHPINVRVGGFYKLPARRDMTALGERLKVARDLSLETVRWAATLPCPDFEQNYQFVALQHPTEYAITEGRLVSSTGLDIAMEEYERCFEEEHVEHSNALHSIMKKRGAYLVGPLARYSLNFDRLSPLAQESARSAGLSTVCRNPFQSILVRGVETVYVCDEALRIIDNYEIPDRPVVPLAPRAATGCGGSEAPRGFLYHRYSLDERGRILTARIVPPTSQNQKMIESDLRQFVSSHLDLPQDKLTWQCEQIIRNHDPCISCATHFLKMKVEAS